MTCAPLREKIESSKLHCVTVIFNPCRYKSRYEQFFEFKKMFDEAGVPLWVVEVAIGRREFVCTEANNPYHLQLASDSELWFKEIALNLLVERLPREAEYIAWIDADVYSGHGLKAWLAETVQQLQRYKIVQMFQTAIDLGPDGEALSLHKGFVHQYQNGQLNPRDYAANGHPGFAWAAHKSVLWDKLGGLIDWSILGSGDRSMCYAWIHKAALSVPDNISPGYLRELLEYETRCKMYLRKDIGFVPGTIYHWWGGRKKDRQYADRWKIITKNDFDPDRDLKQDWQGLFSLNDDGTDRSIRLRDEVRKYFGTRREDARYND
jgi:hypothetical protein